MTAADQVTTFSLEEKTFRDLARELSAHTRKLGIEHDGISCYSWENERQIPEKYAWMISFWVEGGNEGYYVHVGYLHRESVSKRDSLSNPALQEDDRYYTNIALCKVWDSATAQRLTNEIQRFLEATRWN